MEIRMGADSKSGSKCKIEGIISIDERGQMIIPKEVRKEVGFNAGDKLALIKVGEDKGSGCLMLMKADILTEKVNEFLGPLFE